MLGSDWPTGCLRAGCIDNLFTVFSPVAMPVVKEATGVPRCMGLELGLFFTFTSPGLEEIIGVKDWLGFDSLGDVVTVLAFFGGDVATAVLFDAVVAAVALFVGVVITGLAFVGVAA